MRKKFNITGLCFADEHYMADVSKKLEQTMAMVEDGDYFIINRPRQYGKTTTLYSISELLQKKDYIVFNTSFEGIGDAIFKDETAFASKFVSLLSRYAMTYAPSLVNWIKEKAKEVTDLEELSYFITELVNKSTKKIVLIIDEVDKSSNNQLFISFLAMLRNKYLERRSFKTFHSVVLAGLHDVKSLKIKLRPNEEQKYNSPWNIAAEFTVNMNLQVEEIKPMLEEYARDKNVQLDVHLIAERLFYYTSGYPFLVSKLCKIFDEILLPEKSDKTWTLDDIDQTVRLAVRETNTNFESLVKNLEGNPDLYELVYKMLVEGESRSYSNLDPIVVKGLMYGVLKNGQGISIQNRIYEEIIFDYMTSKAKSEVSLIEYTINKNFILPNNSLNMELILSKFQTFMREQYSEKDRDFLERNGRLIFLAFIKPIINGKGFDFKEVQISEERRLDVVITYLQHKYIAELKIWRGQEAHTEGLIQLNDYLNRARLNEGYLIIFDHSKKKTWKKEWQTVGDKKIFVVWV